MKPRKAATVLIIDDNKHLLVTLQDFLAFEGFTVASAASGEEALELLNTLEPDLIILDVSMPGMGGIAFLKQISNEDGIPHTPVIILTAHAALRSFFSKLPVDAFLSKPCSEALLVKEINRGLSQRQRIAQAANSLPSHLMLVENDSHTASTLSEFLTSAGFRVDIIESAAELLKTARETQPDVILLKDGLPLMKGHVVAPLIGIMPSTQNIPIVLYGKNDNTDDTDPPLLGVSLTLPSNEGPELLNAVAQTLGL
jgi:CheY-like chemotaxis protein